MERKEIVFLSFCIIREKKLKAGKLRFYSVIYTLGYQKLHISLTVLKNAN